MADVLVYILNKNFEAVKIIDNYMSFIWTDRYDECGDFEICASEKDNIVNYAIQDYYIWFAESEHLMIIEEVSINEDIENGNKIIISGRSIESILDRRIIWDQIDYSGNLQNGVKELLTKSIISPSIANRKISNFIFEESTDTYIKNLKIDFQYMGDSLYDAICEICQSSNIGFKITLNSSNKFVFKLYYGADRTYDQSKNPYVIFSPNFENILNSEYYEDKKSYKNTTLVVGKETEELGKPKTIIGDSNSGLNRREIYTDARSINDKTDDGENIPYAEYLKKMTQKGNETLSDNKIIKAFDGKIDTTIIYKYKKDFFLGDLVQTENDLGKMYKSRIMEIIFSQDSTGYSVYPSFNIIDE